MTPQENYHDWLRDAHAMEKQAESMLSSMSSRIDNYPDLRARIDQHLTETQGQIQLLEEVMDRNGINRSVMKDATSKMSAMGQTVGGMFASDEVVKGAISSYVFEQFEIACYTSLIRAAEKVGDTAGAEVFKQILTQEKAMAEWAFNHLPDVTEQFLLRDAADGVEAKK
ncbi:ferritin-like domain-containing protein [Yokenella regensburgei]|uniref:ferritin-like domain-containing protein n=1 Tax=Yokenella regensburgei TaxID=158877 RepID=UPI003F181A04